MRIPGPRAAAPASSGSLLDTLLAGAPDAVTSGWCLWVWVDPLALGTDAVKSVVLMMVLELILLNATGFFTAIPLLPGTSTRKRVGMLLGLCAGYLLFVLAFAMPFHAWWPFAAFGWLAFGKLLWVLRNPHETEADQLWLMGAWAYSVIAYIGAVCAGVMFTLPPLGITPGIVPLLHLPSGGEWVDTPHTAVASAAIYFAALALFKWLHAGLHNANSGRGRTSPI